MGNEKGSESEESRKPGSPHRVVKALIDSALRKEGAGESENPFDFVKLETLTPEEETAVRQGREEVAERLKREARDKRNENDLGRR